MAGILDDAGAEKEPLDIIAALEAESEINHLLGGEPRASHIRALTIDAIVAIENAMVGEQQLEQRDTSTIRSIGVADAHPFGRTYALPALAIAL